VPDAVSTFETAPSRRELALIWLCIILVVGLAWAYLVHLDRQMSTAMEHDMAMEAMGMSMQMPWTAADVGLTIVMWSVMMVGMMAGSALPVLLLIARGRASRGSGHAGRHVAVFAAGYLAVWIGFSVVAAAAQWMLHEAAMLSPMMTTASPRLGGAILIAAGAYQLTPVKGACLTHCRSPLGFLMGHWRDGLSGAFQMGLRHGLFCLGCCWAVMCVLFVVGVMNLFWVAAITAFVLLEKVGPGGVWIARLAGIAMIVIGIRVVLG
jgi:predicted metal-binding membrane protein